jgi:hypothetical protein
MDDMRQINMQAMRAKLSLLYLSQIVPNTSQIAIDEKRIQILLEAVRMIDDITQLIRNYEYGGKK